MPRILVTENIAGKAMDELRAGGDVAFEPELWRDPAALAEALREAEAVIVRNQTRVTAELIAGAPKLKIVARAGAGLDNIDTAAASEAGIVVSFAPSENSLSVAELALGLMISLARKISAADRDTRAGGWKRAVFTGGELSGKTLGVVGIGRIGTLVARRARAFGMRIVAHDEFVDPEAPHLRELGARLVTLDELAAESDFITTHVPLTEETRHLFGAKFFAAMKPGAFFVNTSRGEVVDEAALAAALESGHLGGAALDVREVEPPAADSPLGRFDNVILTPHIAAFTDEAQERVVAAVCRDAVSVLRGEPAAGFFNFPEPRGRG
ncbi:MAG: hydroxyacid dehydrogenase [Verrucomicrobiae bacterium]|nr:hydroxyacid dehydrogenase [Verrucomicrobiae bacterium]